MSARSGEADREHSGRLFGVNSSVCDCEAADLAVGRRVKVQSESMHGHVKRDTKASLCHVIGFNALECQCANTVNIYKTKHTSGVAGCRIGFISGEAGERATIDKLPPLTMIDLQVLSIMMRLSGSTTQPGSKTDSFKIFIQVAACNLQHQSESSRLPEELLGIVYNSR